MPKSRLAAATLLALCATAATALADDEALKKLQGFQSTGGDPVIPQVDQSGKKAENLKALASKIKVPDGFKVELYAVVPDARHMAVGNNVGVVFVGTRKTKSYAVTDRDGDNIADEVKEFAPTIAKRNPNGVCFTPDGFLYVVEHNRILLFPAAEFFYENPDVAVEVISNEIVPKEEESFNHGARTCVVGPDNKLYITLGQPFNVTPKEKRPLYDKVGLSGIIRMDRDGKNREVFALGVRNSVGMAFKPGTSELWFTDNQVDGMGDDIPPGELNRATKAGQNFGFPWYGGGKIRTKEYEDEQPPAGVVAPEVEFTAHAADLGMRFYTGSQFPEKYQGGIFVAEHGSWNRTKPVGARVMFVKLKADGTADKPEVFADGWLDEKTGRYLGRPVDVAIALDGSLLVSDDLGGAIWRISKKD
ncbi:PQQ-dependent sugar dehydrogenase [Chelatococcus sambhunathii]|uniref:PQQ-dependent sugar dehydrogenase n=1 Tax=Chelatococcus sambhunathii TaxID=363953 RepID=A0ABU1DC70_9HYPH|nr:PQQ-dependent sugar dehydrogenase [Chelatococcus sambhunathii]MDR4305694.1 PQQ-dependent sugar dehydrogenase [Chelatococcus sambhunathii]